MDSPYLRREPLSDQPIGICYYCGCKMTKPIAPASGLLRPKDKTVDHVKIRSVHGNRMFARLKIRNLRPCCFQCNQIRNMARHCCGVLMMALMMAEERGLNYGNPTGHTRRLLGFEGRKAKRRRLQMSHSSTAQSTHQPTMLCSFNGRTRAR